MESAARDSGQGDPDPGGQPPGGLLEDHGVPHQQPWCQPDEFHFETQFGIRRWRIEPGSGRGHHQRRLVGQDRPRWSGSGSEAVHSGVHEPVGQDGGVSPPRTNRIAADSGH